MRAIGLTLLCLAAAGCTQTESLEPIVGMAVGLDTTRAVWIRQGRPDSFDPSNDVRSSVEHYYTFTNDVSVAGQVYHCHFAVRSDLIHTHGAMVIADDGTLLWIYDKNGKVILSPEKNGIERVNQ